MSKQIEGFSVIDVEAAAHGTPTVAFATGGIIDAVVDGQSGFLIENQDYEKITQNIISLLNQDVEIAPQSCKNFAKQFSWGNISLKINTVLNEL